MEKKEKQISAHDFFTLVKELLAENRQAVFTVTGYSMLPFLGSRRDQVCLDRCEKQHLRKGAVILFQKDVPPYHYILHRIYKVTEQGYHTMGDGNTFMDEPIRAEQVIGIVTKIYRKGKEIDCSSVWFRLFSGAWRWMKPFRGIFLGLYRGLSRVKRRMART